MQFHQWLHGICAFLFTYNATISAFAFTLVFAHATVYGQIVKRVLELKFADRFAEFSVSIAVGLVCFGTQLWLMGFLGWWHAPALVVSLLVALCVQICLMVRTNSGAAKILPQASDTRSILLPAWCRYTLICAAFLIVLALVVAGIKPPYITDEVGYHWAAPVEWAQHGHWIAVPYRYMNSACLAELLFLVGAIFKTSTAAHWTHTLFFLVLVSGCVSLTRICGGTAIAAVAACLSAPVLVNQAAWAFNDVAAAAIGVATLVSILCSGRACRSTSDQAKSPGRMRESLTKEEEDRAKLKTATQCANGNSGSGNAFSVAHQRTKLDVERVFCRGSIAVAVILLIGALSTKPALAPALAVSLYIAVAARTLPHNKRLFATAVVTFAVGLLLAWGIWSLHTKILTGKAFDANCVVVLPANANLAAHQEAIAKLPSVKSMAALAIVPFVTPIFGQQEPYGSRTGLLAVPFALLLVCFWKSLSSAQRRNCLVLLGVALAYYLLVGAFTVRVRYFSFAWALVLCLASAGLTAAYSARSARNWRTAVCLSFCLLAGIGMADEAHVLMHWPGTKLTAIIPSVHVFE